MLNRQKLHMSARHASYLGDFGRTSMHVHGAPALLIGLSGKIRFQSEGVDEVCHSVLVDANVPHIVDCLGEQVATLYWEVDTCEAKKLREHFFQNSRIAFEPVNACLSKRGKQAQLLQGAAEDLFRLDWSRPSRVLDSRVAGCIEQLRNEKSIELEQANLANSLNLSTSRLTHLFKHNTGISYRQYRQWSQINFFMREIYRSGDITQAALHAGFYDSSHLSNTYRKVFGLSPSIILNRLDEFVVS